MSVIKDYVSYDNADYTDDVVTVADNEGRIDDDDDGKNDQNEYDYFNDEDDDIDDDGRQR